MTIKRVIAIAVIFVVACGGWIVLGTTTAMRSTDFGKGLGAEVEALWGVPLVQEAPSFGVLIPGSENMRWIMPAKNDIQVDLQPDYRKKGLLWFSTYTCSFNATYTISNDETVAQKVRIHFAFPAKDGTYDAFAASINDTRLTAPIKTAEGVGEIVELPPGQTATFSVAYKTRGIREWRYRTDQNAGRVQNLNLVLNTQFRAVDFPEGCLSPMASVPTETGAMLTWQATDLITKEDIGVVIPEKLNPGPLTSRITFFAPVCLLFFFVLVATINILYKVNIHPMHYLFVAAGFFAFHLLLAYMVGLVNIHVAFVVSAIVSVFLVTSYLAGALHGKFPWKVAVGGQIFFLVLFSYSFFFQGITGLTVAIGSVVTLAVLMRVTAHVDWDTVFMKQRAVNMPPPPPVVVMK